MSKIEEIMELVIDGEDEEVVDLVQEAIDEGLDVQDILKNGLIKAMDVVGPRMASGEMFVPEVLMCADAMHAGLDVLKPHLSEDDMGNLGTIVIGTVEGDLHDIGKNLVAMMLEASGFKVIDIGIDQSTDKFVKAIEENNADIVGLSALLTTTMPAQEETVKYLKENGCKAKIMVGGAPVSQEFADEIGADGYSEDGASAVIVAKQLMGL